MLVSPSLLSANFIDLKKDIDMINESDADFLHLDVMDGVFVPNISFGFPVMKAVARHTTKPLDVHLMIVNPEKWIPQIRDLGAYYMNVHFEACTHLNSVVSKIHEAGMKAGITLNPATPVFLLEDIIKDLDLVLLMSVNPGFGGQTFINNTLKKIADLKSLIAKSNSGALIEVDGGINEKTSIQTAEEGVDMLVAGSYIFNSANPIEKINYLKKL